MLANIAGGRPTSEGVPPSWAKRAVAELRARCLVSLAVDARGSVRTVLSPLGEEAWAHHSAALRDPQWITRSRVSHIDVQRARLPPTAARITRTLCGERGLFRGGRSVADPCPTCTRRLASYEGMIA